MDISATGNSPAMTRGRGAGKDLREDGLDRWVPTSGDRCAINDNRLAHEWDWTRRHCSAGMAWRKRPETPFSNLIFLFYFDFSNM
jgi:hypothetical protein